MDSEDLAYSEGHNKYHDGYTLRHNPYKRFTPEWQQWKQGWLDEKSDDPYWETVNRIQKNTKAKIKRDFDKLI